MQATLATVSNQMDLNQTASNRLNVLLEIVQKQVQYPKKENHTPIVLSTD